MRILGGALMPLFVAAVFIAEVQPQYIRVSCGADDFRCDNGKCIERSKKCDHVYDCPNQEDELDCDCDFDEFRCESDGLCIAQHRQCDNQQDCSDGSDERGCESSCPGDQFSCPGGGCAIKCNGEPECSGGQDEDNCEACSLRCDGKCIPAAQICDQRRDCYDGSDEMGCDFCNRPDDFRCDSGECLSFSQKCNNIPECEDGESDERDCESTMDSNSGVCGQEQFQCVTSLECIDRHFYCDGHKDCEDNTDEPDDCQCPPDSWQCRTNSQCIPSSKVCDGTADCSDSSDESDCNTEYTTQRPFLVPTGFPTTNYPSTVRPPIPPGSGFSVDSNRGPVALNLKTYPRQELVRNGGDVVLQCRDEGPARARVKWHKERGFIKEGSTDVRGRLEMFHVTDIDSGVYVCEAEDYSNYPGAQVRVSVIVQPATSTQRPSFGCQSNEATCGNGQCIPKSAVCNNVRDCSDGSDEESCHFAGVCEPNAFKCNNGKCVLKTWICDSEDDCGDNSDEQNCGARENGRCSPVEFACKSQNQCIPRSFHCDLQSDCFDGSDEIGCVPVYVKSPPKPQNVKLNPGDTLTLRCEAVGVPVPLISWRLNWGHVPSKCTWTSENGVGELTCPNMQPDDSGAYSCEAMNNKGTTFATPDAIVFVNKTDLCPRGYFNNEARSESECIRCFCFGKSTQCRSADLFTYNMPTPLGEGGTRLLGIKATPNGQVQIDTQPIANQYYYQPLRNGATVTKFGDASYYSNSHPYLTLPESYNGNQLKSYGGHIKYTLSPHTQVYGYDDSAATIIIKGKYGNLFHLSRAGGTAAVNVEARFIPEGWSKYPDGSAPAAREDIMMVLDDIEMILVRADLNNAGVNITDFVMESAEHINVGLGAASLVEECTCPKGYVGLSCQKCAAGFARKVVGPWLGDCEPEECPPGTYGDPSSGLACRPCPCPLTNRENQFARTCSLGPDGSVICDCFQGYQGQTCEACAPGYEGNPLLQGNSCRPKQVSKCDPVGTKTIRPPDECVCKDNVQGRYCDQCKNETFFLSTDFRHGCADCFCSGITQQCTSSNYRRRTISVQFNVPQIVDQVKVYSSAPAGRSSVRYSVPKETDLRPQLQRGEIFLNNVESSSRFSVYYWSMPPSFAGDKVTAYGGYLRYVLRDVPSSPNPRFRNTAADVQLISDNKLIFHYFGDFGVSHDRTLNASIQLIEKGWQRPDGNEVTRAQFLLALADVKTVLIKATYSPGPQLASPVSASIEIAEPDAYGPVASQVEQCKCPPGYIGTSCEDCMPGYTRNKDLSGLYLGQCDPCQCSGKSNMCHPESGECYECADNTAGPKCEVCKVGYERDVYGSCVPIRNPSEICNCDPRGTAGPCDSSGKCYCKQNVEGDSCDRCRPGTFGLDANNPDGCLPCYCSGVSTDCHEGSHYTRVPVAAPVLGDNYGGYTITDLNAQRVIRDNFVPVFQQSELAYNFQFSPDVDLYWSLPIFPGNRVLSYGGSLSLRQKFSSETDQMSERGNDVILDGGDIRLFWTNPNQFPSGVSYSYQVPLKEEGWYILNTVTPATHSNFMAVLRNLKRVLVRATVARDIYETTIADVSMDTAAQSYDPTLPAAKGIEVCMKCPTGYSGTSCEICDSGYYKDERGYCSQCSCNGHDCQLDSYGQVVCNCRAPYTGRDCGIIGDSTVTDPTPRPQPTRPSPPEATVIVTIDSPTIQILEVGSSVTFTCSAQSRNTRTRLPINWMKKNGNLPLERTQIDEYKGILQITNLQVSDSGVYVCETNDGISTGQAETTLKVPGNEMTQPSVEISPSVKEYYEGQIVELECKVAGNPTPTIRWQRGSNRPLPPSVVNRGNFLIIENPTVDDSGEYRCIASNTVGIDDRTAMITIRPRPPLPASDKLTVSNLSPSVDEGQSIRIVCTGSTNVPAGSIDWVRQDNALFTSNVRSNNGVLYVEYATPQDQGVYICQSPISNVASIPILLTVVVKNPEPESYKISTSVDGLKIPTGGSGTVDCIVTGRPAPLIKWTKNGGPFGPGTSQRGNTLIINDAQESDQGYYLCTGTINDNPVVYSYVYVEIERREPPKVMIYPEGEQAVTLGGQHELQCRVVGGIPEPDVTWNRNGGRSLSPSTQLQPHNVLRFDRIEVNDEGEYTCTARNDAGTASASAVLKVRSLPEITIIPTTNGNNIQISNGDPLDVECRATGIPEPMVSISFNNYDVVPPQPSHANLHVRSASYKDDGYYTCTATSAAGTVTVTFTVSVERGDGAYDEFPTYDEGSGDNTIDPDDNNIPSENNEPPSNLYAIDGQKETVVYCNHSGNGRVMWSRADNLPMERHIMQSGSRLVILNVSKRDSGQYVCNIYDEYGQLQHAVYTTLVVVTAPRISLRPPVQSVRPGQSPTVECVVEGDDIFDVTWTRYNNVPSSRMDVRNNMLIFHQIEVDDAGEYQCTARSRHANATAIAEVIVSGPQVSDSEKLVYIEQPPRAFRVGDNVNVRCVLRNRLADVQVQWFRPGTNEFVASVPYGDGAMLSIQGVTDADAGIYRCVARDPRYGRDSFDDFELRVESGNPNYPGDGDNVHVAEYTAHLRDSVDLPCQHDLEPPVNIEWRREYSPLPPEVRSNQPNLRLESVTEAHAGTYICRVSNNQITTEARAILTVKGVVPMFNGEGYIALPSLKEAYTQFDIEISFKPNDENGLLLYNSQDESPNGDYIALQLKDGVPEFILNTGNEPVKKVIADRPLQLNTWHTIRLSRTATKVTMDVDNSGPFIAELAQWALLELENQPLYIGGVRDYDNLPIDLAGASGFIGCVSMLVLGREEKDIMMDSIDQYGITECNSCSPNLCRNNGFCQEARNERGYMCICAPGFAGQNCDRTGEACRPGLCGPGKCTDTATGYKCACPVTHTGTNCESKQSIEYPAFTGSAYLAIKQPGPTRTLKMSMNIKAASPVTDGIIMYCAESPRGYGGFTSLAVHNGKLEFRFDLGKGSPPVILTNNKTLSDNAWTNVHISRIGSVVSLKIDSIHSYEQNLPSPYNQMDLSMETPIFVGGVDDSITLNKNVGVSGGFNGCIKDFAISGQAVDIVNQTIKSANVQECVTYVRGDIPEDEKLVQCQCRNGGRCISETEPTVCSCTPGFTGQLCEDRVPSSMRERRPFDPCSTNPCQNGGTCRPDPSSRMNYTCDCQLGHAGSNCQIALKLSQSVGFSGNGYLVLPHSQLRHNQDIEPAVIAMAIHTTHDGILLYQGEAIPDYGDYIMLRIERGVVILEWDRGSGQASIVINEEIVTDGERHQIIAKLIDDGGASLSVDSHQKTGSSTGISSVLNADSNIYIGGLPEHMNQHGYPGFNGCIEQVELMNVNRGLDLGEVAVAGRNAQRCKKY